jgi:hypothetical protein
VRQNAPTGSKPTIKPAVRKFIKPASRAAQIRKKTASKPKLVEIKASMRQRMAAKAALSADPSLKKVKLTPRQTYAMEAKENAKGIG